MIEIECTLFHKSTSFHLYDIDIFCCVEKTVPSALPSIENKSLQINIKKPRKERLKKVSQNLQRLIFFFFFSLGPFI